MRMTGLGKWLLFSNVAEVWFSPVLAVVEVEVVLLVVKSVDGVVPVEYILVAFDAACSVVDELTVLGWALPEVSGSVVEEGDEDNVDGAAVFVIPGVTELHNSRPAIQDKRCYSSKFI